MPASNDRAAAVSPARKGAASSQQAAFDARQEPSRFLEKICEPAGLRRDTVRVPAVSPLGLGLDEPGQRRPPWPALTFELTTGRARRRDRDGKIALRERDLAEEEPRFSQVERHSALLQRCHACLDLVGGLQVGALPTASSSARSIDRVGAASPCSANGRAASS